MGQGTDTSFATVGGRLGDALGPLLVDAAGGWAFSEIGSTAASRSRPSRCRCHQQIPRACRSGARAPCRSRASPPRRPGQCPLQGRVRRARGADRRKSPTRRAVSGLRGSATLRPLRRSWHHWSCRKTSARLRDFCVCQGLVPTTLNAAVSGRPSSRWSDATPEAWRKFENGIQGRVSNLGCYSSAPVTDAAAGST